MLTTVPAESAMHMSSRMSPRLELLRLTFAGNDVERGFRDPLSANPNCGGGIALPTSPFVLNRQPLLSYLNDTLIRARYASTLPFLSCTSSLTTSATLKSLKVLLARVMAAAVAFSQDSVLVPTSSMTLYTFSAMTNPPGHL